MTTFRLREMRERAGMTQRQLAALVGRWPGDISNWETGKHIPRLDVATDIAIALGCSLDELAGIEAPKLAIQEIADAMR